jgi:hypothetical protein
MDPDVRRYLAEAAKCEALAEGPTVDPGTFKDLAEQWREMARRTGWDGKEPERPT